MAKEIKYNSKMRDKRNQASIEHVNSLRQEQGTREKGIKEKVKDQLSKKQKIEQFENKNS